MKKVIKQALSDISFLIFVYFIMPLFCLLLVLAVALTLGLVKRLNEFTMYTTLATAVLILVLPLLDNDYKGVLYG